MNIKSIEPTPSPNTMKVILDEELPGGKSNNYKKETAEGAPQVIQEILKVEGVKGVYHVADFLAVERNAKFDWKEILPKVRAAFGESVEEGAENKPQINEHFGEVNVHVQMFSGIPMQVKLSDGETEKRFGLPERFQKAVLQAQQNADNVVLERKWKEQGVRYGDFDEIGKDVVEELQAAYSDERLTKMTEALLQKDKAEPVPARKSYEVTPEMLEDPDWTVRFAHLEQMNPKESDLPVLDKALNDEKASIRRLAAVYLGMIEESSVLPYLYKALKDKSVTVRRTAGDCLSDIGDPSAMEEMMLALKDKNKLVRWRAAMFLYEVGDESALEALKQAENDPEFEVSLQIKMAIERIEGGEEAKGSVWKQMTESRK
ncbi:conserved virulence factor C family protein [Metabacillus idriensis]|uniref:Virulence factor n=1 Tax=Metabacillus idriensis TaxID=324768 RepID=A0A6I2MC70_9BACI|nr:conserved virulence factor C family protein [Metabacillus idriensis]MCM3596838.1 conserved virulence factor C family protein [Metabacillus idriensis]MRX55808.1 virulence factor [Metabacillus idriensis]OHR63401.1 virulence factor [Bacillus sp. HMSC76G11]